MEQVIEAQFKASGQQAIKTVIDISNSLKGLVNAAGRASKAVLNFTKDLALSTIGAGKYQTGLSKIVDAFKRIVFYRAIRSAIREITQGFKEGVSNLYQYSLALNNIDAAHAVSTMNEFATVSLYIKNSLGAMVMPILEALVPVVNAVANAFVTAANAVNQFFHALKGESMFTRARKYAVDYAEGLDKASGSAKELKKQVFGFDELNIFNAPSGGGGGGGTDLDYSEMFEEAHLSDLMEKVKAFMDVGLYKQAGKALADGLNEIISNFDAAEFGNNLGTKIRNGLQLAVGFLTNFDFKQVGSKLGQALNGIIAKVNFTDIGTLLARKLTMVFDFAIGFLESFDFGTFTKKLSQIVVGFFDHLSDWLVEVDWRKLGETFFNDLKDAVTGIDFGEIARSIFEFFGEGLAAALDFFGGIVDGIMEDVGAYFQKKTDECGGDAVAGFLKGILDGIKNIGEWIYNNVILPFVGGFLRYLGIENGASTVFKGIGTAIIDGLLEGLKNTFAYKVVAWVNEKVKWLNEKFNISPDSPRILDSGGGGGAGYFAEGGQPQVGSLFWAGEAGAELVGQVGGRTTVTTHDQFSEGMADIMDNTNTVILQAAQALIQAINSKDMTAVVNVGDRQIVSAYDRGKRLAGSALVL